MYFFIGPATLSVEWCLDDQFPLQLVVRMRHLHAEEHHTADDGVERNSGSELSEILCGVDGHRYRQYQEDADNGRNLA